MEEFERSSDGCDASVSEPGANHKTERQRERQVARYRFAPVVLYLQGSSIRVHFRLGS